MFRMTRAIVYSTAVALGALASSAGAQSADARLGIGVALNPIALGDFGDDFVAAPIGLGNFTVPVRVADRLRVEPELGILRVSSEFSNGTFSGESNQTVIRYGLAVHFLTTGPEAFRAYFGPRVGFIRRSSEQESSGSPTFEEKRTDNYLGVTLGGEYWFTSRFSLGAEIQVNRLGIGDEETPNQPPSTAEFSSSVISNNGIIAVRFYLF